MFMKSFKMIKNYSHVVIILRISRKCSRNVGLMAPILKQIIIISYWKN